MYIITVAKGMYVMSKAKFNAAKELINEKKYKEARAILKTIDHPTARNWEQKLDAISPEEPDSFKKKPKRTFRNILAILAVIFVMILLIQQTQNYTSTVQQAAVSASLTLAPVTQGDNSTTIPQTQQGTRSNPYSLGTAGEIRDGRFQVNNLQRDMTDEVIATNQFNKQPQSDEEWVLVDVTFYCDLSPDETCNVSFMDIELVGSIGSVYKTEFGVIDNRFEGEVFGDGSKTGVIGYIVKSSDTNLLASVNDLGDRTFFSTQ